MNPTFIVVKNSYTNKTVYVNIKHIAALEELNNGTGKLHITYDSYFGAYASASGSKSNIIYLDEKSYKSAQEQMSNFLLK